MGGHGNPPGWRFNSARHQEQKVANPAGKLAVEDRGPLRGSLIFCVWSAPIGALKIPWTAHIGDPPFWTTHAEKTLSYLASCCEWFSIASGGDYDRIRG